MKTLIPILILTAFTSFAQEPIPVPVITPTPLTVTIVQTIQGPGITNNAATVEEHHQDGSIVTKTFVGFPTIGLGYLSFQYHGKEIFVSDFKAVVEWSTNVHSVPVVAATPPPPTLKKGTPIPDPTPPSLLSLPPLPPGKQK